MLAGCATCGSKTTCCRKASHNPIVINRTLGAYKVTIHAKIENGPSLDMFHAHIAFSDLDTGWKAATNGTIVFDVNQINRGASIFVANNTNDIFCVETKLPEGIQQNVTLNLTLKKCPDVQSHQ